LRLKQAKIIAIKQLKDCNKTIMMERRALDYGAVYLLLNSPPGRNSAVRRLWENQLGRRS